jgi:hypothetical protein
MGQGNLKMNDAPYILDYAPREEDELKQLDDAVNRAYRSYIAAVYAKLDYCDRHGIKTGMPYL